MERSKTGNAVAGILTKFARNDGPRKYYSEPEEKESCHTIEESREIIVKKDDKKIKKIVSVKCTISVKEI